MSRVGSYLLNCILRIDKDALHSRIEKPSHPMQNPLPGVSRVSAQPCSAEHSLAAPSRCLQLLMLCCQAGAALCCCCLVEHRRAQALASSSLGSHLIQDRLQDCFIRCALHLPSSWMNVQEVLSDAGSTSYRGKLAFLLLVHATCLSAQ